MSRTLLVATHNAHKTEEIRAILADHFDEVSDLTSVPGAVAPDENGTTFLENSAIKALAASREAAGVLVLADDSGLEVDGLGGEPGVYSSRYAGIDASDADNRARLLAELKDGMSRQARFRCVLTLAKDGEVIAQFDGKVEGRIAEAERGSGGFGYDSLFIPEGYDQSFGELPATMKNQFSHRARALEAFRDWLDGSGDRSTDH